MCADRPRVGILGGTFDPVHLGHLASAREVAEAFSLDRVLLVLAGTPPHKDSLSATPAQLRWQMLELAAQSPVASGALYSGAPLEPCDIELRRDGPSWTVDTLSELKQREPDTEFFLILGIDAYQDIDTWSRPEAILELSNVIVTSRPGHSFDSQPPVPPVAARDNARYDPDIGAYVHTSGHRLLTHRIRGIEVSATEIRRRVRDGQPIDDLTGASVARFINEHQLYRPTSAAVPTDAPGAKTSCKPRT